MTEPTVRDAVNERRQQAIPPVPVGSDGSKALALRPDQDFWSPKQVAALNALGIRGAGNADLAVFQHYCLKTRLDPFTKQIYFIKRKHKHDGQWVEQWTIQVGIDGYRVIAQRAAKREGVFIEYEDTVWIDARGDEFPVWIDPENQPYAAKVTVVKHIGDGLKLRFPGVARFDSYAAKNRDGSLQGQWPTMGDHMIEKCAEAFALRRAFPHDLGGMYVEEELQYVDYTAPRTAPRRAASQDPPGEWTVEGHVEPPGESGETPQEPPAGQAEYDEEKARKSALSHLQKVFREFGMGAKDQSEMRSAVVTGLLNEQATELTDVRKLTAAVLDHAAESLMVLLGKAEEDGKDPNEALDHFAQAVLERTREPVA